LKTQTNNFVDREITIAFDEVVTPPLTKLVYYNSSRHNIATVGPQ